MFPVFRLGNVQHFLRFPPSTLPTRPKTSVTHRWAEISVQLFPASQNVNFLPKWTSTGAIYGTDQQPISNSRTCCCGFFFLKKKERAPTGHTLPATPALVSKPPSDSMAAQFTTLLLYRWGSFIQIFSSKKIPATCIINVEIKQKSGDSPALFFFSKIFENETDNKKITKNPKPGIQPEKNAKPLNSNESQIWI